MTKPDVPRDPVIRVMLTVASLSLCVMMLVVVGDVVLRVAFNTPLQGAYDVVGIALLVMMTFGIAPVVARRSEILIDLIDAALPAPALRALGIAAALLGIGLFTFCGWAMIGPAMDSWRYGDRSLELGVPKWTMWAATFVGMLGIFWGYLLQLRASLRHASTDEDTA